MEKIIYRNILAEAAKLGFSNSRLADELEISKPTLRSRLIGQFPFTATELRKLSGITGQSIDYLLEEYGAEK